MRTTSLFGFPERVEVSQVSERPLVGLRCNLAGLLFLFWGAVLAVCRVDAAEAVPLGRGSGSVVVFCCDFAHYPPIGNLEISYEKCAFTNAYDQWPHLLLGVARGSRLSFHFSLPEVPEAAFLEAVHLSSLGADGKGESPISVTVNGKTVVEDWNVEKTEFCETRWPVGDKLRGGDNRIEWKAGDLGTHYWLRRVRLYACFDEAVDVTFSTPRVRDALFLESHFSQCSYNALATVLDHFYGVGGRDSHHGEEFEKRTFVAALEKCGVGEYYGWAPYTSYMVQSGVMQWNGQTVSDLKAERFALATKDMPTPEGEEMIVRYAEGEEARLKQELLSRLAKGPIIIWTPYAAAMDEGRDAWRHVREIDASTRAIRFRAGNTHSVVLHLEGERVKVYDASRQGGVYLVEPATVVATTAAMAGSVHLHRDGGFHLLQKKLRGIEDKQYNVVFWKE